MPEPVTRAAADDVRFMAAAIRLGRRELGRTWPNPAVGALIVAPGDAGGTIVGRGRTGPGGRPHAETVALAEAGARARGACAYVSLEPCAHHGKTPPCCEALIAARIARVVTPFDDPNPLVQGRGHAMLRQAGIEVVTGVLPEAAQAAHAGHRTRVLHGRPWVTLKLAVSGDGCIAGADRRPVAITGPQARARAHMLRATHDAIIVGIGTAIADDPELTCRLPGMADRSPVRVVLDSRLRLPHASRLLKTSGEVPVWVVSGEGAEARARTALETAGARVLPVAGDPAGRIDVAAALSRLAEEGVTRVLAEGGAEIAGALIAADLVDEAIIFTADRTIGPGGLPAVSGAGLAALTESGAYTRVDERSVGDDRMTSYLRAR
jgi:diaminohydroxyphosphoribosylaminopyrimidine deaminase / 5-amino-6-(5-phosphoribosylamino)uracil reductase